MAKRIYRTERRGGGIEVGCADIVPTLVERNMLRSAWRTVQEIKSYFEEAESYPVRRDIALGASWRVRGLENTVAVMAQKFNAFSKIILSDKIINCINDLDKLATSIVLTHNFSSSVYVRAQMVAGDIEHALMENVKKYQAKHKLGNDLVAMMTQQQRVKK